MKKHQKLNEKDIKGILYLRYKGWPLRRIANLYGVSHVRVYQITAKAEKTLDKTK